MRPPLVVVFVLVALPALATANAPPVASASVQAEAVLFEPVTFTSTSHDPDGVIVSTVWTDSNGRDALGASFTRAFEYPGLHTIGLRVTDDRGAVAETSVSVLVRATLMHGRALALAAGSTSFADTGDVSTPSHVERGAAVGEFRQGGLRAAALDGALRTLDGRALARASVGYVYVPVPVGYVLATGVESEAIVGCAYPTTLTAKFTQLRLNDAPLVPPGAVAPNTRVALPGGGEILLNVQETPAPDRLGVTAMRVLVPGAPPIEIARAEAGASDCPYV